MITQGQQARPTDEALKTLSDSLESKQPWEILEYALRRYAPHIILAC